MTQDATPPADAGHPSLKHHRASGAPSAAAGVAPGDVAARARQAYAVGAAGRSAGRLRLGVVLGAITVFYAVCWQLAQVEPARLLSGLPKLGHWLAQAWPPKVDELGLFLTADRRDDRDGRDRHHRGDAAGAAGGGAGESQHHAAAEAMVLPVRWFLNGLRGIDSFVFALLFVAAVGLGPFAGVIGIALHTWGSAAKLMADHIENAQIGPLEAIRTTGAGRFTAILYGLLPDVLPVLLSTTLFWWEFNVRASTVLGVVGAGGIGLELKNSMDLLDFSRLFTIIALILVVVTLLDQLSSWLRRRLT